MSPRSAVAFLVRLFKNTDDSYETNLSQFFFRAHANVFRVRLIPDYQLAYSLLQIRRNPAKWPQFKQGDSVLIRLGAVPVPVHHRPIWKLIIIIEVQRITKRRREII